MAGQVLLAFDLGAESGRVVAGSLAGGRLEVKELSRFPNPMTTVRGHLRWDILHLVREIERGLDICGREVTGELSGLGVDTWGVDFGLLGSDGDLLGAPYVYRDRRTEGAMEGVFQRVPRERVYELTGIQVMPINTLYQLYAMVRDGSPQLAVTTDLLFTPDLLSYILSGRKVAELSIASTSQLFNPREGTWAEELFQALGISPGIMQEVIPPGVVLGPLDKDIARRVGLQEVPVIATAGHDTASAVAAAPAEGKDWAYLSSGTWSLMGVESDTPIISQRSLDLNFTNEGGVGGTFRVLKNITGLWLVQQCRQSWARERLYSYEELTRMAAQAEEPVPVVDPNHASFLNPPNMPQAIAAFCEATGQQPPRTHAAFVRCALVSLATKYRQVLEELRTLYSHPINRIHVIGGGARNELLCQLTADVTGLPVVAGPTEATAIGNLLVQALALRQVESPGAVREIVRRSFPATHYTPHPSGEWEDRYRLLSELGERAGREWAAQ